jgi:hypothetical protein
MTAAGRPVMTDNIPSKKLRAASSWSVPMRPFATPDALLTLVTAYWCKILTRCSTPSPPI